MNRLLTACWWTVIVLIFIGCGMAIAAVVSPPAPPTTKWDKTSGCTLLTLGTPARPVEVRLCAGADGTGGTMTIPPCPNTISLMPANSFCSSSGGIILRGTGAPYTLVK